MPKTSSATKRCPLCGKPEQVEHQPFCSHGCKDCDLLKWLGEGYRIAGHRVEDVSLDSKEGDD
jgi:endogenous inhibitor of DNA gyrase (YacG/DUF329 family)